MQGTWEDESRLQRGILLAIFRGEPVQPVERDCWLEAREQIEQQLASSDRNVAERELSERIGEFEERLDQLEQGEFEVPFTSSEAQREALALESVLIGERFRWLRRLTGEHVNATPPFHPSALLGAELEWVRSQASEAADSVSTERDKAAEVAIRAREQQLELTRTFVDGWLLRRERGQDAVPDEQSARDENSFREEWGEARSRGVEAFEDAWRQALEYHQIVSDLDVEHSLFASQVPRLQERHSSDLARCREKLTAASAEDREKILLQAARALDDRVSGFISEGDLLEIPERIRKLEQAIHACDEFRALLQSCPKRKRDWFRSLGTRLRFAKVHRRLRWSRYYCVRTARSLEVQGRLEAKYGKRRVHRFENLVFFLIFALFALVGLEWYLDSRWHAQTGAPANVDPPWAAYFHYADLSICLVLLLDFFVRWAHASWRFWYLRQHFVFDFLPALPYGFIAGQLHAFSGVGFVHAPLILRLGRALRGAAPVLRLFRLLVFLVRGLDRVVQRFRAFLDRHVLLFESEEQQQKPLDPLVARVEKETVRSVTLLRELAREMPPEDRVAFQGGYLRVLAREAATLEPEQFALTEVWSPQHDVQLETLVDRLVECDVLAVERVLGRDGAEQISRLLRWVDLPLVRRLPFLRALVPAAREHDPLESVSAAARQLGLSLQRLLSIFRVWGDLSGITTGPQILDRVATAMIRATQRPAVRLLLFGGVFLIVTIVFRLLIGEPGAEETVTSSSAVDTAVPPELVEETASRGARGLHWLERYVIIPLQRILGWPLLILGSLCLVANFTGRWFKRIAGEALDVYLRTAEAHFFPLLKDVKQSRFGSDLAEIDRRVLGAECRLRRLDESTRRRAFERLRRAAREGAVEAADGSADALAAEIEIMSLLYRDFLDSTPLDRNDDPSSIQLLGNMAMRDIRLGMLGHGKRELRQLERLALRKDRLLGYGPYLWFRFISESLAIETAKLVIEYNSHCIPRSRVDTASPAARERFEAFLQQKETEMSPAVRRALRSRAALAQLPMVTTEFHSLHFLSADPRRDARVGEEFGDAVRRAMVRDRRAMVRDIFGTWPYEKLPRSVRRINVYRVYFKYFRGARIYLLPFLLLGRAFELALVALRSFRRVVREVLGTVEPDGESATRVAGFDVAERKIHRMRKPYFMEAMRLRAAVDVEYLGLRIPGEEVDPHAPTYVDDLRFVGALEPERRFFENLRRKTLRDLRLLRQYLADCGWSGKNFERCLARLGEADPGLRKQLGDVSAGEVLRALVAAFNADRFGLRRLVVAHTDTRRFFDEVLASSPPGPLRACRAAIGRWIRLALFPRARRRRRVFQTYWDGRADLAAADGRMRSLALNAFLVASKEVVACCKIAARLDPQGRDEEILGVLRRIAAEHSLWSHKLITLRMVQTVTVLDVQGYRDLIWTLGGFADDDSKSEVDDSRFDRQLSGSGAAGRS